MILTFIFHLVVTQEYKLVFSDEFDYEGPPDPNVWSFERGFVRNEELQYYQPNNAICHGGVLTIEGRKERVKNPDYVEGSSDWKTNREYADYSSSSIITKGLKEFLYGRFEIRARIPTASGSWPAIWAKGINLTWPACGEIDIMEFYRPGGTRSILANVMDGKGKWHSITTPLSYFTNNNADWVNQFHIWRMDWDEEAIRLYLDDELFNETFLKDTNGATADYNPFNNPLFLLVNLAIGKSGGTPDDASFPLSYEIDYVRVFQKN